VAAWIHCRRIGAPPLQIADAMAMVVAIGIGLGRIANFINAELWGRPTDLPWGVIFPGEAAQACPGPLGMTLDGLGSARATPRSFTRRRWKGLILGRSCSGWPGARRLKRPGR
jgi:phosphatidylglycerol:prolipoprotein diacylglycerol transferase